MYLDELAAAIRGILPLDTSVPDDADELFVLYGLLARAKGADTTLSDVHDAWVAWQARLDPAHPALIPFDELSVVVQREDAPFLAAIHAAAARSDGL